MVLLQVVMNVEKPIVYTHAVIKWTQLYQINSEEQINESHIADYLIKKCAK